VKRRDLVADAVRRLAEAGVASPESDAELLLAHALGLPRARLLTLVGVVDADLGLSGGDLRAAERTFQLLYQVGGRAGREAPGRVLLQTTWPHQPVIEALDSVSIVLGDLRLTPLLLIKLGALLIVALWLTNIASNFIESRINRASDLTPSIQVLLVKIIRIGLMVVAIATALGAVGINLSALAVFTGAAGVGIGLGLQKIVANFISGIILLADKSVKPGDLVTIGDSSGRISAMKTRYISVAAGDGREFLIPNEDLVTQKVVNWTYTDKNTLVKVLFSTNYDADPRLVCKLAIEIAAAAPRAIKNKPPNCILTEFAEAGMKFSLTFWIADPDGMDNVKSDVMLALWDVFKREGIRVPYPVREIRVRGGALPVEPVVEVSG